MSMRINTYFFGRAPEIFSFNQKRVSFDASTVVSSDDGEFAAHSNILPHIKSQVLCEDLNSTSIPNKMIFSPGEFWDYLYSDSWGEESSLRVLDGELLQLLFHGLNVLVRDNVAASRNTYAFAKHTRDLRHLSKEDDSKIEEIIFIDLTCYGINDEYFWKPTSVRTAKESTVIETTRGEELWRKLRRFVEIAGYFKTSNRKQLITNSALFTIYSPKSVRVFDTQFNSVDSGMLGKKGPIINIPLSVLSAMAIKPANTSFSPLGYALGSLHAKKNVNQVGMAVMPSMMPKRTKKMKPTALTTIMETIPGVVHGSDSSETQKNVKKLLKKFKLDEVAYIRKPLSQHYYLNQKEGAMENKAITARKKLNIRKKEILQEREKAKEMEIFKEKKKKKKIIPEIKISSVDIDVESFGLVKTIDKIPSFRDLVRTFLNKSRKKKKKRILKRRKKCDVLNFEPSPLQPIHKETNKKISMSDQSSSSDEDEGLMSDGRMSGNLSPTTSACSLIMHDICSTVSAHTVTESWMSDDNEQPTKLSTGNIWKLKQSEGKFTGEYLNVPKIEDYNPIAVLPVDARKPKKQRKSTKSFLPDIPEKLSKRQMSFFIAKHKKDYLKDNEKVEEEEEKYSHLDFDSEELEEDYSRWLLKLNRNFSLECIANKASQQKKKQPRNKLETGLAASSETPSSSSSSHRPYTKSKSKTKTKKSESNMILGKLKPFKFLSHADYVPKEPEVVKPDFESSNFQEFKWNLIKALNDFVIRKENMMSSHGYRYISSVTFTRPEIYKKFKL